MIQKMEKKKKKKRTKVSRKERVVDQTNQQKNQTEQWIRNKLDSSRKIEQVVQKGNCIMYIEVIF